MSYKFLILGLLAKESMSGYDIKKHIHSVLGSVTTASYGTLYPTLHRLLAEGRVVVQEIPQRGRPAKKVYSITEQGRDDLKAWLNQPAGADQVRREFLLKLYLARHLGEQNVRSMVASRRMENEALLQSLEAEQRNARTTQQAWITDYALSMCRAEIHWLERFEAQMDAG